MDSVHDVTNGLKRRWWFYASLLGSYLLLLFPAAPTFVGVIQGSSVC